MRKLDEHGAVLGGRGYSRLAFSPVGTDCPLCEALDGLVFWKGSRLAKRFAPPLHPGCDCEWVEVGDDECGPHDYMTLELEAELQPLVEEHGPLVGPAKG